jgi:hypothetical protein
MKFSQFLEESKENHAVLAFGRMNPPTTGHAKLVDKVHQIAAKHNASHHVVLSHSQDAEKNPLSPKDKVKHAKRYFPDTHIEAADKEHPTILHHASKLHKQGVTHLHVVAGSDRKEEMHNLLHRYNTGEEGKHGSYKFKKITVHSAGHRDPDAEGTEGMSASKMRAHAKSGNYEEFKKGIPQHVHEKHKQELYHDVRKHMGIRENIEEVFQQLITEGVHDKGIFKAIFLGGGPGSGKDYVLSNTLDGHGLTEINSDNALEFLMDKKGLDKKMPDDEKAQREVVRGKAKSVTELKQRLALHGRNGLIINGTADDPEKIAKIKERLEELGYDTAMLMVNTKNEVSALRNIERGQRGGRSVPEDIRREKWESSNKARVDFAKMFNQNYVEFDNSEDLRKADGDVAKQKKFEMESIFKQFRKFVDTPPKSDLAKEWIAKELEGKSVNVRPSKEEINPHPDSRAAEQARNMGLEYYGFGRYGNNHVVTHRVVHDNLVQVKDNTVSSKDKQPPIQGTSGSGTTSKKTVKEMYSELTEGSLQDKMYAQHQKIRAEAEARRKKEQEYQAKRKAEALKKSSNPDSDSPVSSGFGKQSTGLVSVASPKNEAVEHKKKEDNLQKEKNGQVKKYLLRKTAAKEAHRLGGEVVQLKNGYGVKLNEMTDDEPGMALSPASKEKIEKKTGKVTMTEMTGDETGCSIGDQKEDELKKKGISLSSFKSKKVV